MNYSLHCTACNAVYGMEYKAQICAKCGNILEVEYSHMLSSVPSNSGFWGYESILPKGVYRHYELGSTKLIPAHSKGLHLKMEIENPTRSFKDRGSAIEVAKACEYGFDEIVCASTGNMAYSISYYAKLYGIKSTVFIGGDANKDKLRDIRETHDARTVKVKGDFTKAQSLAEKYSRKHSAFLAGDYCYRKEGQSTLAYELLAQIPAADYVFVPVGNATLINGITKVFRELKTSNAKIHIPKVVGVESTSCNPLEKAFRTGVPIKYQKPRTKADAIAVGLPTFAQPAIEDLHLIGGDVVAVTDKQMAVEQKEFYSEYGLVVELAGVASVAAYKKLGISEDVASVAIISGGNV